MRFFLRFALTAGALFALMKYGYLQGVQLQDSYTSLLVFVFILGLVNLVVGGVLRFITLPIRFLTMGVIGFAISLIVVKLTDEAMTGVILTGGLPVIIIALVMGVIGSIFG